MGLCAAWSSAFDLEALVEVAEWFIPDSLFLAIWLPHHTVEGEGTNT